MKVIIFFFCLLFSLHSCKKKEKETTNNTQSLAEPQKINGSFSSIKQYQVIGNSLKIINGFTYALLFDSLRNKNTAHLSNGIDAGNISVNNITLKKEVSISPQSSFVYTDSSNSIINKPQTWAISGSSNFPSLSFNDDSNYPSYLGYQNLPDTLLAGVSNTIIINSYYGADGIDVLFRIGPNSFVKSIHPPTKYLILSSNDMGQLTAGGTQRVDIRINFFKNEFKQSGNRIFQINNAIYVWKDNIYIKE